MANTREILGDQETLDGLISDTLEEFEEDEITSLLPYILSYRKQLKRIKLPNVSTLSTGALEYSGIIKIDNNDLPNAKNIYQDVFYCCYYLTSVVLPSAELLQKCFELNYVLNSVETGTKQVNFDDAFYQKCENMEHLIISSSTVSNISGNLKLTKIGNVQGAVYVPENLVESYRDNNKWNNYFIFSKSNYPISEYPDPNDYFLYLGTIKDSWTQVFLNENYSTDYSIGDTHVLYIDGVGLNIMQIAGFDKDEMYSYDLDNNVEKAPITWIARRTSYTGSASSLYSRSTTTISSYLDNNTLNKIPSNIRSCIVYVNKIYYMYGETNSDKIFKTALWIPSYREVFGGTSYEKTGVIYDELFIDDNSRIMYSFYGVPSKMWLRTNVNSTSNIYISINGRMSSQNRSYTYGVPLSFCTGNYHNIIIKNLLCSIAKGTFRIEHELGECIYIKIDDDVYEIQIVGFRSDENENGNKIPITFIMKNVYSNEYQINDTNSNEDGWEASTIRNETLPQILDKFPSLIKDNIVPSKKRTLLCNSTDEQTTIDTLWLPSAREVGKNDAESSGVVYNQIFTDNKSRIKYRDTNAVNWGLRSPDKNDSSLIQCVESDGGLGTTNVSNYTSISIGFCFGKEDYYGVEWDYSSSKLTRLGLAQNFDDPSPAESVSGTGSSPFDTIGPWKDMKIMNYISVLDDFVDGTDERFDVEMNDTMVWIPEFYYLAYKNEAVHRWRWLISPTPQTGFKKHPGSGRYVGRYHASNNVYSKSKVYPSISISQYNFRNYFKNKGTGWYMMDIATWSAIQMLYLVEFADFDSQKVLGTGWKSNSAGIMGGTDDSLYHTIKANGEHNMYRYIEDPYSNIFDWVDLLQVSTSAVYLGIDNANYTGSNEGLDYTGFTTPGYGKISDFNYSDLYDWAFIPNTISGNGTVGDAVSTSTTLSSAIVGGTYTFSDDSGMFQLINKTQTTSTGAQGTRPIYIPTYLNNKYI